MNSQHPCVKLTVSLHFCNPEDTEELDTCLPIAMRNHILGEQERE